jgi:hypothetical protein
MKGEELRQLHQVLDSVPYLLAKDLILMAGTSTSVMEMTEWAVLLVVSG